MNSGSSPCFVPGCPNSHGNTTNATFYEFPEDLQEEWLTAIGRNRDKFVIDELVCSKHFKSTDFENQDRIKLKENVIPTINLPANAEPSFMTNSPMHSNTNEENEALVQKYPHDENKSIKILSNVDFTKLKPYTDKAYTEEESHELSSPMHIKELSEYDSADEYHLEYYEEVINCRTCLDDIGPEGGYSIIDVHHENQTLKEMIIFCIPQMALTLIDSEIVCSKCLESIKFCVSFIENCLKVEAELIESHNDHILTTSAENNIDDCLENKKSISEIYHHVNLDHNYLPEPEPEAVQNITKEVTEKSAESVEIKDPSTIKHMCLKCDRAFKTKNYLLDHIRRVHSANSNVVCKKKPCVFNCAFCEKSFLTKLGYDLHLQLSHRDQVEKRKDSSGYTCRKCGDKFKTFGDLAEHRHEVHGFTCTICSQTFLTRDELNIHTETHPNPHLCHMCGKGFRKAVSLKSHLLTHNDPNSHLCHECGLGFKSELSLSLHMKHHNPDLEYQCDQCPSSFRQKYRLNLHKKVRHLGIKEYVCTLCDKKFCYKANLQSHSRLKHSEVKPFQCERCGVSFARADYLKRHRNCDKPKKRRGIATRRRKYRYKRGDAALITCKLCGKVFKDVQMLRLHIKTHTKLRKYKCSICNLTFTTSSNRDRHEKVHDDSTGLYRCEVCFKRMESQEGLDQHCIMSHENSKKYKCHSCGELFGRKYLLHSHLVEKHENLEDFQKEQEVLYKVVLQDYLVDPNL